MEGDRRHRGKPDYAIGHLEGRSALPLGGTRRGSGNRVWSFPFTGSEAATMKLAVLGVLAAALVASAPASALDDAVAVTPHTFPRAETDLHFAAVIKDVGLGKFRHQRNPAGPEKQTAVHMDRDILYSDAVFDLDAGPVTITLPDAGRRYLSLQAIDEDGYTPEVFDRAGAMTLTRDKIGTRYVLAALRIFVDPDDPKDLDAAHALQDAVQIAQPGGPGAFVIPNWDAGQQATVRTGLSVLALTVADGKGMAGPRDRIDPISHLIGSSAAWGALPEADAVVLEVTPDRNEGKTVYRLEVKDAPIDGFWSVSVYNEYGFFAANPENAYTVNSVTAKPEADGSTAIQFGGCDGRTANCLPTPFGWSYLVRLFRPRAEVLSGAWAFPEAKALPPPEHPAPPAAATPPAPPASHPAPPPKPAARR
jgi:hypothetical protein